VQADFNFINDPSRLRALQELVAATAGLSKPLDALASKAAALLNTPIALITFVDADEQTFKGEHGLPATLAVLRKMPVSYSICQFTIQKAEPFLISDSETHPLLMSHPSVLEMGIRAYLGIPLVLQNGHTVAALSFVDYVPRQWNPEEIAKAETLGGEVLSLLEEALVKHRQPA
jgi:GAF domain-containing protein